MTSSTLTPIDAHFWDWALWLGSKQLASRDDVVAAELGKLHAHLLGPLGVAAVPVSLGQAIAVYRAARDKWEKAFRCRVPRAVMDVTTTGVDRACERNIDVVAGVPADQLDPGCHRLRALNLIRRPARPESPLCPGGRGGVT